MDLWHLEVQNYVEKKKPEDIESSQTFNQEINIQN